eukprot:715442-Pyramimonas_sp.AAC.1
MRWRQRLQAQMVPLKTKALAAALKLGHVHGCLAQEVARLVDDAEAEEDRMAKQWIEFGITVLQAKSLLLHDTSHDGN